MGVFCAKKNTATCYFENSFMFPEKDFHWRVFSSTASGDRFPFLVVPSTSGFKNTSANRFRIAFIELLCTSEPHSCTCSDRDQ
jgi:hypothetical protein